LLFGPFLILLSLFLFATWWHNFNLAENGVAGKVTPVDCSPHYGDGGHAESYTCTGRFVSDDGEITRDHVTIEPDVTDSANPLPAKMIGTLASTDTSWGVQLFGGLAFVAIGIWRLWIGMTLWRARAEET
jgi:hypothetical protein